MRTTPSARPVSTVEPDNDRGDRSPRKPNTHREHECQPTTGADGPPDQRVPGCLDVLSTQLAGMLESQTALLVEVQQLSAQDRVLTDLQDQCRFYRERFFEREVLDPVLRGLIGLADRIRRDIGRLRNLVTSHAKGTGTLALTQILEMRQADLIEVETLLAGLGTEPFIHPEDGFNASVQTCRGRVTTSEPSRHGRIADRLLPGYRREDRVVRRELVKVYVTNPQSNGAPS